MNEDKVENQVHSLRAPDSIVGHQAVLTPSSLTTNESKGVLKDFQSSWLSHVSNIVTLVDPKDLDDLSSTKRPGFNHHYRYHYSEQENRDNPMIDNSNLRYISIHLQCGLTAYCRPDVLVRCPSVLQDLNRDIQACLAILPLSTHALVKRTNLWLNTTYYYGPKANPKNVNHSTTHHHEGWLIWVRDRPDKARGIEIYNVFDYRAMRLHWNGCGLILHEICHVIHQFCLGLDCQEVMDAYLRAKNSGLYTKIPRRDWAGNEVATDMAYALVNYKEFFAEMSVSYLSSAYRELDETCRELLDQCSPPLLAPNVVERVKSNSTSCFLVSTEPKTATSSYKKSWFQLFSKQSSIQSSSHAHCNKFYPFTKGQLKFFDPLLHDTMEKLWKDIDRWVDDEDDFSCRGNRIMCLPC